MKKLKKFLPIALIITAFALFFATGLQQYFSLDWLKTNRQLLLDYTQQHVIFSALIFCGVYTLSVTLSLPGATLLTLAGGFLFGIPLGSFYVICSATIGATILFIAAKTAFYDVLHKKASSWIQKFKAGFQKNAISYLLFLRLVPLFPFWLINIIPAFLGVRMKTFVITTFLGIIPGTVVFVAVGNGLGAVFSQGKALNTSIIFKPEILIPIIALAVLSLVPILYQKWRSHREGK